mmetsp:Transcript_16153/g.31220  ORF Transcript_16153/g.31220 Transcript_16153/m.31220 type:complete len:114 (-) Transcript_16153:720-1061(-)
MHQPSCKNSDCPQADDSFHLNSITNSKVGARSLHLRIILNSFFLKLFLSFLSGIRHRRSIAIIAVAVFAWPLLTIIEVQAKPASPTAPVERALGPDTSEIAAQFAQEEQTATP